MNPRVGSRGFASWMEGRKKRSSAGHWQVPRCRPTRFTAVSGIRHSIGLMPLSETATDGARGSGGQQGDDRYCAHRGPSADLAQRDAGESGTPAATPDRHPLHRSAWSPSVQRRCPAWPSGRRATSPRRERSTWRTASRSPTPGPAPWFAPPGSPSVRCPRDGRRLHEDTSWPTERRRRASADSPRSPRPPS